MTRRRGEGNPRVKQLCVELLLKQGREKDGRTKECVISRNDLGSIRLFYVSVKRFETTASQKKHRCSAYFQKIPRYKNNNNKKVCV